MRKELESSPLWSRGMTYGKIAEVGTNWACWSIIVLVVMGDAGQSVLTLLKESRCCQRVNG